jgi:zinc protease
VLVEPGGERKQPWVERLQVLDDPIDQQVVVRRMRLNLRHQYPHRFRALPERRARPDIHVIPHPFYPERVGWEGDRLVVVPSAGAMTAYLAGNGDILLNERDRVLEARLDNGLGLLLKEDRSAPIASLWTWYRVGSRNETPGTTGVSHWVEHMQFKGTPSLEKGQIFRDVASVGGTLNAMTSHDWTAYFETLPADQIDLSLRIEADRMVNSLFATDEVDSERTVILSERQGAENNPGYVLYEEVVGAAFRAHPYRHMVIGYEADLRRMTRDDLYGYYRRFYHPGNAFIAAVGDFDAAELRDRIEKAFGGIASGGTEPDTLPVVEPPQPGERRVVLRRPAGAPYLRVAFHVPAGNDEDLVPLLVTDAILSGGKPMEFGGGGGMGRSSRLYRSLVASGLARTAGSDMGITIDPYLFQIGVTALPGGDLTHIEAVVDAEIDRLRNEPVPDEELKRAIRQLEAQFVYSAEGVTNQAYWLGQWEIVDSWRRALSLADEFRQVTSDDVQRVAGRYLDPERRTVGWLVPPLDGGESVAPEHPPRAVGFGAIWGLDGPLDGNEGAGTRFERALLRNGTPILGQNRPESRSVALRVRIAAGSIHEADDEAGLANLTARSLLRGSGGESFEAISARTDSLGSSIAIDSGREFVEIRVRSLRDDLDAMIELAARTLLQPDFPEDEVVRVRAEQVGAISEADNDTRATADRLLRRAVYPAPNPLGRRVLGTAETVGRFDRSAARSFHERQYGQHGMAVAVVGGLGSFEHVVGRIDEALGGWSAGASARTAFDLGPRNGEALRETAVIPGKSQADLAVGIATIARDHPDYYALDVANLILGRLGLMGRLGAEVRDRQGLAYYAFSQIEPRRDGSLWSARAGVDPSNVERAIDAIRAELERIRVESVSDEELANGKRYLIGVLPLALESHDGVAATLLAIEEFGLGLDYLDRYPDIISSITKDQVLAAAREHLDPARLVVGVAGPEAADSRG